MMFGTTISTIALGIVPDQKEELVRGENSSFILVVTELVWLFESINK